MTSKHDSAEPAPDPADQQHSWWVVASFNVALICVLLAGAELAGQFGYFLWKGYPLFHSDRHAITESDEQLFEQDPHLAVRLRGGVTVHQSTRNRGKTVTVTPEHTRWTGAAPRHTGTIRIAVVGGSTTFCSGVTDSASWPARLQQMLGDRYEVVNYGVPGYSSAEGVIQMALQVPEIHPHIVVFYEGWNDLHNYHEVDLGSDYFGSGIRLYTTLALEPPGNQSTFAKLSSVSAIFRLAAYASNRWHPSRSTPADTGLLLDTPDHHVDSLYLRNLLLMKELTQRAGALPIFVPQVLDQSRYVGSLGHWWTPHVRNSAVPQLLRGLNAIMNTVCAPGEADCVVANEVTERTWVHSDFVDEGHLSVAGNEAFAAIMARRIVAEALRKAIHPQS